MGRRLRETTGREVACFLAWMLLVASIPMILSFFRVFRGEQVVVLSFVTFSICGVVSFVILSGTVMSVVLDCDKLIIEKYWEKVYINHSDIVSYHASANTITFSMAGKKQVKITIERTENLNEIFSHVLKATGKKGEFS